MAVENYSELSAWQKAIDLVEAVYGLSAAFPREEVYRADGADSAGCRLGAVEHRRGARAVEHRRVHSVSRHRERIAARSRDPIVHRRAVEVRDTRLGEPGVPTRGGSLPTDLRPEELAYAMTVFGFIPTPRCLP